MARNSRKLAFRHQRLTALYAHLWMCEKHHYSRAAQASQIDSALYEMAFVMTAAIIEHKHTGADIALDSEDKVYVRHYRDKVIAHWDAAADSELYNNFDGESLLRIMAACIRHLGTKCGEEHATFSWGHAPRRYTDRPHFEAMLVVGKVVTDYDVANEIIKSIYGDTE